METNNNLANQQVAHITLWPIFPQSPLLFFSFSCLEAEVEMEGSAVKSLLVLATRAMVELLAGLLSPTELSNLSFLELELFGS